MSSFEVPEPILNSPYDSPKEHWWIMEGQMPERRQGRRPAMYYYREPGRDSTGKGGYHIELQRVNLIRERLDAWRSQGWPGVTRTTRDLLLHWRSEGREKRLFFAQIEAAETVIFLTEARADFRQGIEVPHDEPTDEEKAQGYAGFLRYACKMATGSGKTTVTHVVGLRPFQSQLLCEQVVGRALRRASYEPGDDGRMREEVAKVFGVPFQLIPFKANSSGPPPPAPKRHHVRALPEKAHLEIRFPRVEGYVQEVRNRITLEWDQVPSLEIDPLRIPPEVEMKGLSFSEEGRASLIGPGKISAASLKEFRDGRRMQELVFEAAAALTREYRSQDRCEIPVATLFPQIARLVHGYVERKVTVNPPADLKDLFLSPYYGWLIEILRSNLRGDTMEGETPELPLLEKSRGDGSTADVDFWTGRDVREVVKSHLNYVVADTKQWEQSAAFLIDTHPSVEAFVKNAGLGLGIPYFHNGEPHEFIPDFVIRFKERKDFHLILETKGFDKLKDIKEAAANRWCAAVNAHGGFGTWQFVMVDGPGKVIPALLRVGSMDHG